MRSIRRFGFINPVLIDTQHRVVAGWGRVQAAKQLGLATVPTLRIDHLSKEELRAYVIADNRLAEKAGWDPSGSGDSLPQTMRMKFLLNAGLAFPAGPKKC
jgi:ParB-like chromosome segregation protein Spo0J